MPLTTNPKIFGLTTHVVEYRENCDYFSILHGDMKLYKQFAIKVDNKYYCYITTENIKHTIEYLGNMCKVWHQGRLYVNIPHDDWTLFNDPNNVEN